MNLRISQKAEAKVGELTVTVLAWASRAAQYIWYRNPFM